MAWADTSGNDNHDQDMIKILIGNLGGLTRSF